jgi:uncharacterized membrane protein
MAKDLGDVIGSAIGSAARDVAETMASNAKKASKGPLSGGKGVAAGIGLAALAPVAVRGAGKLVKNGIGNPAEKVGDMASQVGDKVGQGVKGNLIPGMGGDDSDEATGTQSVGKGRRMPIQQAIDVAVPISTAYNQWTQFEDWPNFMHRLDQVSQEDASHVSFKTKIWGISKEFKAEIVEQRPDDRIKWKVTEGVTHSGVVSFHELSDRLTRVDVDILVEPGSLIEKAARGMRHVKRAVRADLSRFKAFVEMEDEETGSWRGTIDDGKVKRSRPKKSSSSAKSRSTAKSRSSNGKSRPASAKSRSSNGSSRSTSAKGRSTSAKGRSSRSGSRSSNGAKASSSRRSSSGGSSPKKSGSRS